jgi:hypothetical protein
MQTRCGLGVCDDGGKAGAVCDGASGRTEAGDIRGVHLAGHCKHVATSVKSGSLRRTRHHKGPHMLPEMV